MLSYISGMNKYNLNLKYNTIYFSIHENQILEYKFNKICTRSTQGKQKNFDEQNQRAK